MDENEKQVVSVSIGMLIAGVIGCGIGVWYTNRKVNKALDILIEHIDGHFQELVDQEFENIIDNYDD